MSNKILITRLLTPFRSVGEVSGTAKLGKKKDNKSRRNGAALRSVKAADEQKKGLRARSAGNNNI